MPRTFTLYLTIFDTNGNDVGEKVIKGPVDVDAANIKFDVTIPMGTIIRSAGDTPILPATTDRIIKPKDIKL